MNKKVIVLGSGGHAKVVIDILHAMDTIEIFGITSKTLSEGENFSGYPVLGDDSVLEQFSNYEYLIAMGIGGYRDNNLREIVFKLVKSLDFEFINIIHPSAIISKTAIIGDSVTIFPGVVLNTEVQIGDNSIVATSSTIDHETIVGENFLISAGVTIGANAFINDNALLALGSKIISGIKVGRNALIAAGAVVINDVADNEIVFGIPARKKE